MDIRDLKEIIEKEGGKIIIVENDKPQIVVMAFDEWQEKRRAPERRFEPEQKQDSPQPEIAKPSSLRVQERVEGLTIDDLPL